MNNDADGLSYEMPWRINYESRAVFSWVSASIVAGGFKYYTELPVIPFYTMSGICLSMALLNAPKAIRLNNLKKNLSGRQLEFINLRELEKKTQKNAKAGDLWLGSGFYWEQRHTQRVHEILKRDWYTFSQYEPFLKKINRIIKRKKKHDEIGQNWIHGVEPKEITLTQSIQHTEGMVLVVGTTGSGKTRLFDLLIAQAILRKDSDEEPEAVLIIDPKGDKELRDNARRLCEALGTPDRFISLNPAFPETSVRINPLRNFTRLTEVASRIADLIGSDGANAAFKDFGWQALNNTVQGLSIVTKRPTIKLLKKYLEGGCDSLVIDAVQNYGNLMLPDHDLLVEKYTGDMKHKGMEKYAIAMSNYYHNEIQPEYPNADLEALLSMFKHDGTHFSKMVASLLPVMNMLTSGDMADLLSPDPNNLDDERQIVDTAKIINDGMCFYLGLDSLTDSMVGSALGSLFLSDLTSVAGDRYNFGKSNKPVNVFVDEASEVINDSFIQLLNKGRGAKIRLTIATQTYSDFVTKLGSEEKALQVLGNINNLISLRIVDNVTQEYVTNNLPKTIVKAVNRSQGQKGDPSEAITQSSAISESLMETESELFPPQLLGMLPNLEYIAKISGGKIVKGRIPILTSDTEAPKAPKALKTSKGAA